MTDGGTVLDVRPYGTWRSPLQAEDLAAGMIELANLVVDGDRLLWTEARPQQAGRQAPVRWRPGARTVDLGPPDFDARTRVHEYGGAPLAARDGVVVACRFDDQRLYRLTDEQATPVTPEPPAPGAVRYADGEISPDGRWLIAVRETHGSGEPANEIVAVDLESGHDRPLVSGHDFVAAPRLSPDGSQLAWLAWDHPYLPWDAAELHTGAFSDGALSSAVRVGGGLGDAACSPVWTADGTLVVSLDGSGFWEVHRWNGRRLAPISHFGADVGFPLWQLGGNAIAPLADGRLACAVVEHARGRLALLDPGSGDTEDVELPFSVFSTLRPYGGGVAFLAAEPEGDTAVVTWRPDGQVVEARRVELPALRPGDRAAPEPVTVDLPDGARTHAFLHRPANADVTGPADERPPLVVFTHGGPTSNVFPVLDAGIAYWTTRGFAVANVNYRGSTGYGRAYREALLQRWGELDVVDTVAVARALAARGEVDGDRMAIRGGSAGGFTTLAVLTTPGHPFACGASFFGVVDLRLLAEHTHKFESRYLDRMVGPLPEAAEVYQARSPLHRADQLSRPILVLQGLDDRVVAPEQAEAIVEAAAARGLPYAYLTFEGEQHGFRRAETIVAWKRSELAFYGQVMGFTPDGDLPHLDLGV